MKKIIILIILFSTKINAQYFEGFVVTNNNDTINCKFINISNLFKESLFKPVTLRNKVRIQKENGEEVKYKPSELRSFSIKGTGRGKTDYIKFISMKSDDFKHFYHEDYAGKISHYIIYDDDMYANELRKEFYIKDSKKIKISLFSPRKDYGELIKDYPDLYNKWMDPALYKLRFADEIIKEYNEYFKGLK